MTSCRTVILAKAPLPGFCKTRLIPALGPDRAAALAAAMLQHTVKTALAAQLGPVELCAAPSTAHPVWASLELSQELHWSAQGEGDLGERMARAVERTLAHGEHVILIGSDCPGLTREHLQDAASALQRGQTPLVPAFDGGYVLLGLATLQAALFTNMPWSTPEVARLTLERLAAAGLPVHLGPLLHDIDETADLAHLPPRLAALITQDFHAC